MTTFSPAGLINDTDYYARVKHTGQLSGESPWSPTLSFKTKSQALPDTEIAILTYAQTDLSPDSVFYAYGDYFSSLKMSGDGMDISDDGSRICLASFNFPSNPEAFAVFN